MVTPIFEEGSLEHKLVEGLLETANAKLAEFAFDAYKTFGILVRGEVDITYRVDDIRRLAEYIRANDYKFEMVEYLPSAYDIDPR